MAVDETGKHEPGWRFDPFDEEVINDYLMPKILGNQLPRNYLVSNAQVYGPASNPWQVFHPDHHSWLKSKTTHRYMFVFAKLSKLSASDTSKNTSKKAGCGTWVGKTSRKKILDHQGNLIGKSRYLVFEVNDTDSEALGVGVDLNKVGYYTMHEYRLSGINEALNSADTVVVCKITHDPSKRPALALKSAIKIANCLSTSTGEAQIKQGNNSSLGATGCLGCLATENPTEIDVGVDETRTFTSNNLKTMDNGVCDNFEESGTVNSESLAVLNTDVGEWCAAPEYAPQNINDPWDDFGEGFSFDDLDGGYSSLADVFTDWNPAESMVACLDSHHKEEPVENKLAKRKFEASEDSCWTKKIYL